MSLIEELLPFLIRGNQEVTHSKQRGAIYFMLCALSIENSFKSVITSKHSDSIKSQTLTKAKLPKILLGHDLVDLARRADYEVNLDIEHALRFLTRYGVWGGKYPLPTTNEKNALTEKHSDKEHYLVGGYDPDSISIFLSFATDVLIWASNEVN